MFSYLWRRSRFCRRTLRRWMYLGSDGDPQPLYMWYLRVKKSFPSLSFSPLHRHSRDSMPSDGLSNEVAQLATLFVQSILYGVYCITLAHCAAMTFGFNMDGSTSPSRFHYPTILVGLLLWMNGTLNLCLGFIRALQALMYHHQDSKIIDDIGDNWINIAKIFTMVVQVLLADWMLVSYSFILKVKVILKQREGQSMLQSLQQIVENSYHSLHTVGVRSYGSYLVIVPQHSSKARLQTLSRTDITTGMCILGPYSRTQHIHHMWVWHSRRHRCCELG